MTNAEYDAYVARCIANGEPILPRNRGTKPNEFGPMYADSSLKRKNDIRRKRATR